MLWKNKICGEILKMIKSLSLNHHQKHVKYIIILDNIRKLRMREIWRNIPKVTQISSNPTRFELILLMPNPPHRPLRAVATMMIPHQSPPAALPVGRTQLLG